MQKFNPRIEYFNPVLGRDLADVDLLRVLPKGAELCRQGELGGTVLFAVMTPIAVEKDDKEMDNGNSDRSAKFEPINVRDVFDDEFFCGFQH